MENPFRRRATEFLREDEAFLAVVTPEPIKYFLSEAGREGRLYDRLVLLRGTPGSGKTTLAKLFEFPTFHTLSQNQNFEGHKDISDALTACGALENSLPRVLGCRLPLETDYRDFWEFGYCDDLKSNLMTALLQARAVLGWFRHLKSSGIDETEVSIVTRPEAAEVVETIGGLNGKKLRAKAVSVETAIYAVMNALIAPPEDQLPAEAIQPYRPFDIIERIRVPFSSTQGNTEELDLLPLAIFDDAHLLHPNQFRLLQTWLLRRELRVARWMIARFDVLLPHEAIQAVSEASTDAAKFPGISADRDAEIVLLQSNKSRSKERTRFRNMAKDMASRYLRRMPVLSERGLTNLSNLLGDAQTSISASDLAKLCRRIDAAQRRLTLGKKDRESLESQIAGFKKATTEDIRLQMLLLMMQRFANRRGRRTPSLFQQENEDVEPTISVAANDDVYAAALFNLHHDYGRPYYFGINDVCDASSENAEQFLQLASELVEEVVTQVARGRNSLLEPVKQDALLRKKGRKIIDGWNFPHDRRVKVLVQKMAKICIEKSREPNGAVIANAIGIPADELDVVADRHPSLASVLQFAIAYNAINLVPNHSCKKKLWCLLEVGGMVSLSYGLTLKRGGFVESNIDNLAKLLEETTE